MKNSLTVWIFQTGEPLHIDANSPRPMRAMNLANMLIEKGHNVVLWSSSFYHQKKTHRSKIFESIKVSDSFEIKLIPSPGYNGNIGLGRLWDHVVLAKNLKKQLKLETKLPDIAFVGYPPIEAAAIMNRHLKSNGVPVILDIKDQWPNIFLKIFPKSLQPIGRVVFSPYFYLAKRAMRDATNLSAMADGFLQWAIRFSNRPDDPMNRVIPLTTPNTPIPSTKLEQARQWWDDHGITDDGTPYIFFVGSHSSAFDFITIFQSAKKLAINGIHCEFVICGNSNGTTHLKEMANELTNVHFPGWVDRAQITTLAERSVATLAPYKNTEDFMMSVPNKVIDSLSLGLPILSPLKGEVEALIKNHNVGLFYEDSTNMSLYECIKFLIANNEKRLKISQNSLNLYHNKFSYEIVYGKLVKFMEQVASEHNK